ncbi:MAG TPA: asparagine synthetase B, partial [Polyangiaceae bacterium]|nr:asparagine synthetase B [Polyangiaceae bacterium]
MCGICGIVGLSEARDVVERMNAKLTHRGPDHQAVFHERDLALGISRLAILDVEGGNQPMFNEDESVVTVHNGEIYNFRELRDDLIAKGHSFGSTTDSEVLVHAYEQWGTGMVERLEGMFAFCIWDRKARRLLLARDRFGEKPLFFHRRSDGLLAFGSELASLLAYRGIERRPHREALGYYLRVGFVPEPLTAFAGVESLPPGHTLVWEEGGVTIRAYYR